MRNSTQARDMASRTAARPAKVIAISSGKGGVGKTNVAVNIAVALAAEKHNVMLLDADLSLANVDVLLGLQPRFNLSHVVSGDVDLDSTIIPGPRQLRIVPAASGNFAMTNLPAPSQAAIINAFSALADQPDILVVDTAAGIADNVARFVQAAQEAVVVICDEPSSITDAYALMKVFSRNYGVHRFQVVTNQTRDEAEGQRLFRKISTVTDNYLDVVLRHIGNVPHDQYLRRAVQEQRSVVDAYPKSPAGQAFRGIARKLDRLPLRGTAHGGVQFFLERALAADNAATGRYA